MDLQELHRHWDQFGQDDPLWAILTDASRKGGKWDPEDFFATGRHEIDRTIERLGELGLPCSRSRTLDFGCGVGRLTQALCHHFESAVGVDISEAMIGHARRYNQHGDRCQYLHNLRPDLSLFPDASFDFVNSALVLQHMAPDLSKSYIREFFRVLRPQGVAVFQVIEPFTLEAKALGKSAYRASIRSLSDLTSLIAGASALLRVEVRNDGTISWLCPDSWSGRIRLGNHWLDSRGRIVIQDDGRADLEFDLSPGASAILNLAVTAPKAEGTYSLALDMVHEGVCWFTQKGSHECRLPVVVSPETGARTGNPSFSPRMEMHGVSRYEVEAIMQELGIRLVAADFDSTRASGYKPWVYYVRKDG